LTKNAQLAAELQVAQSEKESLKLQLEKLKLPLIASPRKVSSASLAVKSPKIVRYERSQRHKENSGAPQNSVTNICAIDIRDYRV
jgi:hypothetical protein